MPLLNYTTEIDADKSIHQIQKILGKIGAAQIMTDYAEGIISAIAFTLVVNGQTFGFRLPCDWRPVYTILHDNKNPYSDGDKRLPHQKSEWKLQAVRVAWRIVKDWVEAQCAIIETKMVKTEQVFLPYLLTKNGETLYQQIESTQFRLGDGK